MNPQLHDVPDAEKCMLLREVLIISDGNRAKALQYLEHCKQAYHPDAVQIGVRTVEHLVGG